MNTLSLTFEDAVNLQSGLTLSAGSIVVNLSGAVNPLYYLPTSVKASLFSNLVITGALLTDITVFLVLDGVLVYWDTTLAAWNPVAPSLPIQQLSLLGMLASSLDLVHLVLLAQNGQQHEVSFAFLFNSSGGAGVTLTSLTLTYGNQTDLTAVHFTRVYGSFVVHAGITVPATFLVQPSKTNVLYNNSAMVFDPIEVTVNADGTWEVYLPDTDSVSDTGAGYLFYFQPANPVARKVPLLSEVAFRDLPIARTY